MGSFRALSLIGVAVFGAIGSAQAADLLPPAPRIQAPVAAPDTSGWYLRGDVGVAINQNDDMRSRLEPYNAGGGAAPVTAVNYHDIQDSGIFGLGVGYQFNNWFRGDLTGEYKTSANYRAGVGYVSYCNGPESTTYCLDTYNSNVSTGLFLANGYVDLGTWGGFTPYVGAGVGFAATRMGALTDNGQGNGYAPDKNQTHFAWAAMGGVAFDVTQNVKIDMGYRYTDMGRLHSNPIICGDTNGCFAERQSFRHASHDFRIGFRYIFNQPAPPPVLVTKY